MNAHEWCTRYSTTTGKPRAVLLALAEEAGDDDYIRSSVPALCAMIGLKWTDGQPTVKALVKTGELAEQPYCHTFSEGRPTCYETVSRDTSWARS